jgi:uncharacterized membrane protein
MIVLAYDKEYGAYEGRRKLIELDNEYVLNLNDAVEVIRESNGRVKIKNI